jgi:hypothetical protein
MGSRLYEEFKKKLKVPPVQKFEKRQSYTRGKKGEQRFDRPEKKDIVIAIPLKGGTGVTFCSSLTFLVTD